MRRTLPLDPHAHRQPNQEFTPAPDAAALHLDPAAVQLDQLFRESQSDPETLLDPLCQSMALGEHLEDAGHLIHGNPDPVVANAHECVAPLSYEADRDPPARVRVLHRVVKEVREDLSQTCQVAFDMNGLGRNLHTQMMPSGPDGRTHSFDGAR